jgi:hypothetical protein
VQVDPPSQATEAFGRFDGPASGSKDKGTTRQDSGASTGYRVTAVASAKVKA